MPKTTKKRGVSKGVRVTAPMYHPSSSGTHAFRTFQQRRLGPKALQEARDKAKEQEDWLRQGASTADLRALADYRGEEFDEAAHDAEGSGTNFVEPIPHDDDENEWEDVPDPAADSITYALRDILSAQDTHRYRVYKDTRTWAMRMKNLDENWAPKIPLFVTAYMQWKYGTTLSQPTETLATIDILDIYSCSTSTTVPVPEGMSFTEALVAAGYLGTTPLAPSLAISIKTLELFRTIRLFKSSFSTEAFTKLLCHHYYIPYRRYYRTAIADAFDIYLTVLAHVDQRVQDALGRSEPDWRARNSCPPCAYEIRGEERPKYVRMVAIDGNNSLKRLLTIEGRQTGDAREFHSDYFLPRSFVDRFANEVKSRQSQSKPDLREESDSEDEGAAPPDNGEGYLTDGTANTSSPCATNWKAAAADETKKMWGMFDETGVFLCACRHSMIIYIADMVRSGELAKYALAMTSKLNDVIPGKKMIGYDIGCAFEDTVLNSSLRDAFLASGSRFCVPAFHGYSHSYNCQCRYHPNAIEGVGLEDFETDERVFNRSNELAPVTRCASRYRRHMLIDVFCRQWDHERYANIGQMLHDNYLQALDIIEKHAASLSVALKELGISEDDLTMYEQEEKQYFSELQDEDPANLHTIVYVEALQALQEAKKELADTSQRFRRHVPRNEATGDADLTLMFLTPTDGPVNYESQRSETVRLERRRRQLLDRVDQLTSEVVAIEAEYNIDVRWQPADPLYRQAVDYIATRRYQRALGKLQRLVIQRLFELQKMNVARTGYKVRTYLAKSLQRRCKAIRTAVKQYNDAALALSPPRETVDWTKVSHYSFIEEFALLQGTRNDIREKAWARPEIRETMRMSRRITRAHEELRNANREIRRMHTWIRDEEVLFRSVLASLKDDAILSGAVSEYCKHRRAANARNMAYIEKIYRLEGFSGIPAPGVHTSSHNGVPDEVPLDNDTEKDAVAREEEDEGDLTVDDRANDEVVAIMDYLSRLTT